nr:hypothetical protein [Tanacetum cinerariifolium]
MNQSWQKENSVVPQWSRLVGGTLCRAQLAGYNYPREDDDNPERHRHATRRVAAIKLFRTRELIIEAVGRVIQNENEKELVIKSPSLIFKSVDSQLIRVLGYAIENLMSYALMGLSLSEELLKHMFTERVHCSVFKQSLELSGMTPQVAVMRAGSLQHFQTKFRVVRHDNSSGGHE